MSYPPPQGAPPPYGSQPYDAVQQQTQQSAAQHGVQYQPPASMSYSQDTSYQPHGSERPALHQHQNSTTSDNSEIIKPADAERGVDCTDGQVNEAQKSPTLHATEKPRIPGKFWLSRTRIYLYILCWLCTVLCLVFGVMALFVYYWQTKDMKSKPVEKTSTGWSVVDRTLPGKTKDGEIISAWPFPIKLNPTLLQIGTSGTGVLFFLSCLIYPCFSSKKRYYKLTGFEIYEIIGTTVVWLLAVASFAYAKYYQNKNDLWGFACKRREDTTLNMMFGESKLFPDVKYAETCNDLNNVTYLLLTTGILSFIAVLTWIFGALYALGAKRRGYARQNDQEGVYVAGSASGALAATACCDGCLVCCLACTNCLSIFS